MSSWGGLWGLHEAAHQKKWHGFCNWCDWNAGPVPWVDLQKQRLQHAYDTGGDPNSPEGQGGHVSVVSDVPHPLSLVDGKRYPITYVPFRPGDETAQAVRARYPGVAVMHNGDHIGQVEWHPEDHPTRGSEVSWIDVDPEYQRHGIATSLFDWAKEHVNPALHHSDYQTAQGEEWLNHLGSADGIRYAAVVDADVAEDMRRLAMPAPMPEGITFHYHPTNDTIPTKPWPPDPDIYAPSFSAPAVEARHNGKTVGFLEWDPPLHSTTIDGVQYGDYPPEISMIKVHRDYRRHGVATAMFDFARRHQGDLSHSPEKTAQGEAWADYEQSRHARLAMAWDQWAPQVQGGCGHGCDHSRMTMGEYSIQHPYGRSALQFTHDTAPDGTPELYISGVHTNEGHRRSGVAEALLRRLHDDHPGTRINPGYMTDMGQGLKDGLSQRIPGAGDVLARIAAVTGDLVDRLNDEYHQWYDQNSHALPPNPYAWRYQEEEQRGPLGYWPHIESFLEERYPAAHQGFRMGLEDAQAALDDKDADSNRGREDDPLKWLKGRRYESGPEAVARHGYDPSEIAAGMVLLHNQTHPGRGSMAERDQQRLVDIYTKRRQMQRDYERRNARPATPTTHVEESPQHRTAAGEDPFDAQRRALGHLLHLQQYGNTGVHPEIGGFDPGETVATHPAAHHPLMTNHWAAEVMHPQPVSGPFGLRVQGSTGRYVNALIGVHQNGPQHDGGGTGRRLEDASNELRVELQHSDHISVPDLSEFSPLVVPGHASLLAAVNPRFDHGLPGNSSAARAAYQTNCQRAVLALDARHRGLNVEARPNFHEPGNLLSDEQWTDSDLADFWRDGKNHPATWIDAEDHFQFTPPGPGWWDAMDEEIASWGPQARALVAVTQADPNNPGVPARHVIYAHGSRRGKVNYADPQIAKADASDWRDRVLYGGHPLLFTTQQRNEAAARTNNPHAQKIVRNRLYSPLRFMRIDDKNLDPRAARHLVDRGTAGHRPIVPWPASSMIVQ